MSSSVAESKSIDASLESLRIQAKFLNPDHEVNQGVCTLRSAQSIKNCIFSGGVGTCLSVMLRGVDANGHLFLGLHHYEAGDKEKFDKFMQVVKRCMYARPDTFRAAVVGGYESPLALEKPSADSDEAEITDDGSEDDLDDILATFKKYGIPVDKVIFNPTNAVAARENEEIDVGDHYVDTAIDNQGRFYVYDQSAAKPEWTEI